VRHLVVNADDLGLTVGVNDGIFDAHDRGILTSASLFANAPATSDAIRRVRSTPSLGVGVHLALVDGIPTLPPDQVPTLLEDDGRFRRSWKPFIVACLRGKVSLVEVERELTAQVERLRRAGIRLTHLDGHQHVHAYPPIFALVTRIAARFGIPVVRVPYERRPSSRGEADWGRTVRLQSLFNLAIGPWARRDYRTAGTRELRTPHFVGRIHTGVLTAARLSGLIRGLQPGVTELMVHPGYADDELARTGTRLLASRQSELDLLCSPEARALLAGERVGLLRHDLTSVMRRSVRHVS
jgi:hopanoid biosynthesis associated protein HpnK